MKCNSLSGESTYRVIHQDVPKLSIQGLCNSHTGPESVAWEQPDVSPCTQTCDIKFRALISLIVVQSLQQNGCHSEQGDKRYRLLLQGSKALLCSVVTRVGPSELAKCPLTSAPSIAGLLEYRCNYDLQGDQSGCDKPPVDRKTKVPF